MVLFALSVMFLSIALALVVFYIPRTVFGMIFHLFTIYVIIVPLLMWILFNGWLFL